MIKIYLWCVVFGNLLMLPILDGLIRYYKKNNIIQPGLQLMYKGIFIANFIISPLFIFIGLVFNIEIIKIMFFKKISYIKAIDYFFENTNQK